MSTYYSNIKIDMYFVYGLANTLFVFVVIISVNRK